MFYEISSLGEVNQRPQEVEDLLQQYKWVNYYNIVLFSFSSFANKIEILSLNDIHIKSILYMQLKFNAFVNRL